MNPVLAARLRREWPIFGALVLLAAFLALHLLVFRPLLERYRRALGQAGAMGAILDPRQTAGVPALPPRVFSLLMENSLPTAEADRKGQSGVLSSEMVQVLSAIAARHGLETVVAEPGLFTQQPNVVEGRAHMRVHGSYAGYIGFLNELAQDHRLWFVERFSVLPYGTGRCDIEVYVAGCLLKRTGGAS